MKRNFEGSCIPNNDDQNQNASTSGQHLASTSNPNQPFHRNRHQHSKTPLNFHLPQSPTNSQYSNQAVPSPHQTGSRNRFDAVRGNVSHSQQFRHQTSWNTRPIHSYANQQHYALVSSDQTQTQPHANQQGLYHQHDTAQINVEQNFPIDLSTRQIRPAQPATARNLSQYQSQQQALQDFQAEHSVLSQFAGNVFRNCNFNTAGRDMHYTNTSEKHLPSEETKDAAIKKHQQEHIKRLPESVVFYDEKLKSNQIPDVHPRMHEYNAYKGGDGPVKKEKFIPSTQQEFGPSLYQKPVSFDKILDLTSKKRFIALVGPPGSGKTTLSKQLAKLSQPNQSAKFLLRFMDLNYEQPLTCKQLFVDSLCPELNNQTKENAFRWMVENQGKCVFVFDGYDQAAFSLENMKPRNEGYDKPLKIKQLVANLCCKKFFKESLLLFTSRPHCILKLPFELRPDVTIYVDDLSTEDMKKLFQALAGDWADELWVMLSTQAPQLFSLCHNPLLLQFIIFAILHGGINKVKTVTEVFKTVLEQLRYSEHVHDRDIAKLWKPLGKMAYRGMQEETVVFTKKNLGGLQAADVQDIIIVFARKFGFPSQRLFDGDQVFYFSHQTLQEMFAARYICKYMSDHQFNKIISEVAYGGHWSMVRRFLCGLLLWDKKGVQTTSCKTADQLSKRQDKVEIFRKKLIECMKTDVNGYKLIDLLTDLQECSDDEKDFLAKHLSVKFDFTAASISLSAAHALAEILPRLNRTAETLSLHSCNLNSDTLRLICGGINKMKHGIEELVLNYNNFGDAGVENISGCLRKLKLKQLYLEGCGISAAGLKVLCGEIKHLDIPMEKLVLFGNWFGDAGVGSISGCLRKVKKLVIGNCGISDDGKQILHKEVKRLGLPQSTVCV